jgi:hypothetical protein
MKTMRLLRTTCLATALMSLIVGCGGGTGELSGKVTYQGKVVTMGSVTVVGTDNVPRLSGIAEDGSYSVPEIPAGPVRISVSSPEPPKDPPPPTAGKKFEGMSQASAPSRTASKWFKIPDQYAEVNTSGLTTDVKRGANNYNIDLK